MFRPIDYMKCNRGFNNEIQFNGQTGQPFIPTPVTNKYGQPVQAMAVDYVGSGIPQYNGQQANGFIRKPGVRKFMPPLMQISGSSNAHNRKWAPIENVNPEKPKVVPPNIHISSTRNGNPGSVDNENTEKWRSANRDGSISVAQTPIRGQSMLKSCHGTEENDFMLQRRAPPRPMLGASNVDNTMMSSLIIDESQKVTTDNINPRLCGTTDREKMFIFTGNVERVIKWNKIFCNHVCYFEIIACVVSIEEGSVQSEMIMLLRDKKGGPIIQMVYYSTTHLALQDFYVGQLLRCVGKMNGRNIFKAVSIRSASVEEEENLQRLRCVCDQAVSQHYLNV